MINIKKGKENSQENEIIEVILYGDTNKKKYKCVGVFIKENDEFLKIGVDGVSIGTNDLTMMLLGVDRDNEEVANIYDERNPFVVKVLEHIVKTCSEYNVTSSICGQAASDYPEIVEKLVRYGITSVSVNPDAIGRTRENIYTIEKKHFDSLRRG